MESPLAEQLLRLPPGGFKAFSCLSTFGVQTTLAHMHTLTVRYDVATETATLDATFGFDRRT